MVYRAIDVCADWQEQHKRFLYSEIIKNSPFIYTPEEIEDVIGERPAGCGRSPDLRHEDLDRYRREGVGPNEFVAEQRAASLSSSSVHTTSAHTLPGRDLGWDG